MQTDLPLNLAVMLSSIMALMGIGVRSLSRTYVVNQLRHTLGAHHAHGN